MPPESSCLTRSTLLLAVACMVLLSSCGSGVRPTLTAERLQEPDAPGPTVVVAPTADVAPANSVSATETQSDQNNGDPDDGSIAEAEPTVDPLAPVVVEDLVVQVLETFPHDTNAWTQGLELHDGFFIESTGLAGQSDLRRVDPATGEVTQQVSTPNGFFAEGVTKVGDELIQLTWTEETAFYWDAESFELKKEVSYAGPGWGLCYDGSRLVMTDGTADLTFRDPTTFDELSRVVVTFNDQEVFNLNEIECVNGAVWANLWQTDLIARIDPGTGKVTGLVDASTLPGPADDSNVLNGIAWDDSTNSFYVTGKFWPTMYRVAFLPASTE